MTLIHAYAEYIYIIVYTKYQITSAKGLVQFDFPMYALSKHKQNPYLKANRKKWLAQTRLVMS